MNRRAPFPLIWIALAAMWLALSDSFGIVDVLIAAGAAYAGVFALGAVDDGHIGAVRRPRAVLSLAAHVLVDVILSNVAVARIVLGTGGARRTADFVDVPLELRSPAALAVLAWIVTATPGTAWAGYDSHSGILTLHILDVQEPQTWIRTVKERYERPLLEIFG